MGTVAIQSGVAGAASGISSGAAVGTAIMPGIGTAIGAILGGIIGGYSGGTSGYSSEVIAKKQENYLRDTEGNTQHAVRFFNELKSGSTSDYYSSTLTAYRNKLSDDEILQLESALVPEVQKNAYYGGLGSQYTSSYGGTTFTTVPAVGIAQVIDKYIKTRDEQSALQANQPITTLAQNLGNTIKDSLSGQVANTFITNKQTTDYSKYILYGGLFLGILFIIKLFKK